MSSGIIGKYQTRFNRLLETYYGKIESPVILEMVRWSLAGGKRLRPIIYLDILNSLSQQSGKNLDQYQSISIILELTHNVRLIMDDLPCMDNDNFRRDRETIHDKYGVQKAHFLMLYLLSDMVKVIASLIGSNLEDSPTKRPSDKMLVTLTNQILTQLRNASYGQLLDLSPQKVLSSNVLLSIICQKTSPFFEMGFVSAWVIGEGAAEQIEHVCNIAKWFSLAFQISDDFEDVEQDREKEDQLFVHNYVSYVGEERARKDFYHFLKKFQEAMKELHLYSDLFQEITNYLVERVEKFF